MLSLNFRQKSTEQQELERIEALQKEVAEQRRKNEASYRAALAGSESLAKLNRSTICIEILPFIILYLFKGHLPKKQVLSTTIPKEFNFRSDSRMKSHTDVGSADDHLYKEINFTSQLRKHPSSPVSSITRMGLNDMLDVVVFYFYFFYAA